MVNLDVLINVQYTRSLSSVSDIGPLSGISLYNKYILVSMHFKTSMIHQMLDEEQEYWTFILLFSRFRKTLNIRCFVFVEVCSIFFQTIWQIYM